MLKKSLVIFIIILTFFTSLIFANNFEDNLKVMAKNNAKSYVQPLVTGVGTAFNSGLYKKAKVTPEGLLIPVGFDLGLVTGTAIVPDEDKTFQFQIPEGRFDLTLQDQTIEVNYSDVYQENETATIAGDKKGEIRKSNEDIAQAINENNDLDQEITAADIEKADLPEIAPSGLNLSTIPNLSIQANVRLPMIGVEITGRGAPEYTVPDLGKISNLGVGVRKSLPVPILDVTAGAMYQTLSVGDIFELNNMNYHIEAGKNIGIPFLIEFSPYAGIGLDQTTASIDYTIERNDMENQKISFDIDGENQFRMNLGLTAQIVPFTYLNLEISRSNYFSGTLSAGVILK